MQQQQAGGVDAKLLPSPTARLLIMRERPASSPRDPFVVHAEEEVGEGQRPSLFLTQLEHRMAAQRCAGSPLLLLGRGVGGVLSPRRRLPLPGCPPAASPSGRGQGGGTWGQGGVGARPPKSAGATLDGIGHADPAVEVPEANPRISLWTPPASPYCLIEEVLYRDPWQLLLACMLLNKTSAKQVK